MRWSSATSAPEASATGAFPTVISKNVHLGHTMAMFIVYVIRSSLNRKLYVGFTEDFKQRLIAHNNGDVISTKAHRPWQAIFLECYIDKGDALRREKYLKTTVGKRALKFMLKQTLS